jgi:protein SCO1/2
MMPPYGKTAFHSRRLQASWFIRLIFSLCTTCSLTVFSLANHKNVKALQAKNSNKGAVCHQSAVKNRTPQQAPFQNQSIPDVQILDQDGKQRHFYRDLIRNKIVVINFIFTSCEALCPIQAKTFAKIQSALDEHQAKNLQLISISIDPQKDSPESLKVWAKQFGAKDGWTLVTGGKSAIDKLLEVMTGDPSGKREHSSVMIIGNAQTNRWSRTYSFAPPERVFEILETLKK